MLFSAKENKGFSEQAGKKSCPMGILDFLSKSHVSVWGQFQPFVFKQCSILMFFWGESCFLDGLAISQHKPKIVFPGATQSENLAHQVSGLLLDNTTCMRKPVAMQPAPLVGRLNSSWATARLSWPCPPHCSEAFLQLLGGRTRFWFKPVFNGS